MFFLPPSQSDANHCALRSELHAAGVSTDSAVCLKAGAGIIVGIVQSFETVIAGH